MSAYFIAHETASIRHPATHLCAHGLRGPSLSFRWPAWRDLFRLKPASTQSNIEDFT
jgi:hypothetical protein